LTVCTENLDKDGSTSEYDSLLDSPTTSQITNHISKKQKTLVAKKKKFLDLATETIKTLNEQPIEEDECTIVGKRFAMQLRGMTDHQKCLAEKIISDVMYHGRMDMLTEDSYKFNSGNKPNFNYQPHNQVQVQQRSPHLIPQSKPIPQVLYQQQQQKQQQKYQQQKQQQNQQQQHFKQQRQIYTDIEDDTLYEPVIVTLNDVIE